MGEEKIIGIINEVQSGYEKKSSATSDYSWFKDKIKNNIVETYYDELQGIEKEKKVDELISSLVTGIIAFKKLNSKNLKDGSSKSIDDEKVNNFWEDAESTLNDVLSKKL